MKQRLVTVILGRFAAVLTMTKLAKALVTALVISLYGGLAITPTTATAAEKAPTPAPKKRQTREAYREELGRLMDSNHVACAKDTDCEALGVGAMACGGPNEFLPVSKGTIAKIQTAVTDLTKVIEELDVARNRENSTVGICLALAKPDVKCLSGKCVSAK